MLKTSNSSPLLTISKTFELSFGFLLMLTSSLACLISPEGRVVSSSVCSSVGACVSSSVVSGTVFSVVAATVVSDVVC